MKAVLVGFGSIGRRHYKNLSKSSIEILVCTNRKLRKQKKNNLRKFDSLEKCIREKPDIGIITNVTSFHIPSAIKLAKAGCHLFIEKPLSNSMVGIKNLLELIKEKKLVTLVGCNMRFHPCLIKIKRLIAEGKIGKVVCVRAENGSYLPEWHPHEDYTKSYASREDLGGGVVLTCIHEIDYLYWLFGEVKEVFSIIGKFSDLNIKVDDLSSILFRFKNNIIGELHLDYFQRPTFRSCKIIGTKGTIYWDSEINAVKMYNIKKKKWDEKLKLKNFDENDMYVKEILHFLECVKKKKQTINTVNQAAKILEIALAAKKASKVRKGIRIG